MCFISCDKDPENQDILKLKIASWRTKYTGNMESHPPYTYYVQYVNSDDREKFPYTTKYPDSEWEKFPWVIENFDYVEGYEYVVALTTIKINPNTLIQDRLLVEFRLIEIISKIKIP
jgi:hypothetical protein